MALIDTDTIAAIATPDGRGGIGIVRVSGPATRDIALRMTGIQPQPRRAHFCRFHNRQGDDVDNGIALYFPAPHSFTGEDVLELQGHGGTVVLNRVLRAALDAGARLARPGEFSERAFLNGKLDLAQLEAVADLIDAATEQAARSAMQTLVGVFSAQVNDLAEQLTLVRVHIEACIDFSDEEIDPMGLDEMRQQLGHIDAAIAGLTREARQGQMLRSGLRVVIAGPPNAGKSSLLNALAGTERAIVTEIPGTTRDLVSETLSLEGLPIHILDTAGLRDSDDPVEQEGIRRARLAIDTADRILLVLDVRDCAPDAGRIADQWQALGLPLEDLKPNRVSVLFNKTDLLAQPIAAPEGTIPSLLLSVKTGAGLTELRRHLMTLAGFSDGVESRFMARERHVDALHRSRSHVASALTHWQGTAGLELIAEDLRLAQAALGEITGVVTPDDLLGRIFASFCIGK